ncbi:peptide deformylase [bacterium]|nr:peptide deformylase [bacterium]
MIRKILWHPDPRLREVCKPVEAFDDELRQLVRDMSETMYAAPGIGLAASQIGQMRRVFVIDVREDDPTGEPRLRVFVNPRIVETRGEVTWEEGCLSIPEMREEVRRPAFVTVRAFDEEGSEFTLEAEGLLAVAIQHENDHLNGVLFFDHLSPLKRKLALKKYMRALERGELTTGGDPSEVCRKVEA